MLRTARYSARRHPALAGFAGMVLVGAATWARFGPADLGLDTDFFRMVPQGDDFRILPIRDRQKQVAIGDYLGFTLRNAGDIEVYALSVFGSGDRTYISPWKATDKSRLDRTTEEKLRDPKEPFGFHIAKREEPIIQIVCNHLVQDSDPDAKPNEREGVLVLVAHEEEDKQKIEAWMKRLFAAQDRQDVTWKRGVELLTEPIETIRGGSSKITKEEFFTPEQARNAVRALEESEKKAAYRLGLPNVDEFSIECRVAGT
jgi:flavodoxin